MPAGVLVLVAELGCLREGVARRPRMASGMGTDGHPHLVTRPHTGRGGKGGQLAQTHGLGALVLGVSISLDELAIGLTLGLLHLPTAS